MSTERIDALRGWTSRIAPARGDRPFDTGDEATGGSGCPFCPGGEDQLEEILLEVPGAEAELGGQGGSGGDGERPPELEAPSASGRPWGARAVANRYPFLGDDDGWQEVLIDTPRHDADLGSLSDAELRTALRLYRARLRAAYQRAPEAEAHLFRNQGARAGTSRTHPHGQLVVLNGSTPGRTGIESTLRRAAEEGGGCPLCTGGPGPLHVARGVYFAAWVLEAPLDPGHLRVAPVEHAASFADLEDEALAELASLLGVLARTLPSVAGTADHNLLLHDHGNHPDDPALHWHVELRPRVSRLAGFEQMSGTGVSSSEPERDAVLYRTAMPFELRP